MTVQVVLDPSAILAYGRASIAVGELIMMVGEEAGDVGVPVVALAEAYADAKGIEPTMVEHLAGGLSAVRVLPVDPMDARRIGELSRQVSLGLAHAVTAARREQAFLVTANGDAVRRVFDERLIIDV